MTNALSFFALLFFATLGAGGTLALAAGEALGMRARVMTATALAALTLLLFGCGAVAFSFGRPELIFGVLRNSGTGIFREFASLGAALMLLLLYLILVGRGAFERTTKPAALLAGIAGPAAAVFAATSLYMPWRAGWHTLAMGFPALGWTISAGAALLLLLAGREARREDFEDERMNALLRRTLRWTPMTPLLPAFGILFFLARLVFGTAPSEAPTAERLIAGDLALPFWIAAVLSGIICPAAAARVLRARALVEKSILVPAVFMMLLSAFGSASFSWCVLQLGLPEWRFF